MPKESRGMERARAIYEDNLTLLTIIAVILGLSLRLIAEPEPFRDLGKLARDFLKETGSFLLVTFVIAFIYENFVNYRSKQEFRQELEDVLRGSMHLGIHAVYDRRPTVGFKAELLQSARTEVIEMGTALNTFKEYLKTNMTTDMAPGSLGYRDIFESRLREGIQVTALMLDPEYAACPAIAAESPGLADKIRASRSELLRIQSEVAPKAAAGKGRFRLLTYRKMPHFAAICVDGADRENGRMLLSPYVPGRENASAPVFEIRRSENESLFNVYYAAIQYVLGAAAPAEASAAATAAAAPNPVAAA